MRRESPGGLSGPGVESIEQAVGLLPSRFSRGRMFASITRPRCRIGCPPDPGCYFWLDLPLNFTLFLLRSRAPFLFALELV